MRKGIRIVLDEGTQFQVQDLARRESRPLANAVAYLVKLGLAAKRAEQRPAADRPEPPRRD
jgi:hypothetical protein